MRTFVSAFVMPVLGAGLIYILTNQLQVDDRYRIPVVLVLTLAAFLVAWLIEEKREAGEQQRLRSRIFSSLAFVLSVSGILWLTRYRPPAKSNLASPSIVQNDASGPSKSHEVQSNPAQPVRHSQGMPNHSAQPRDGLLDSIDKTPRSRNANPAWVVQMYSDEGDDFPILRATAQEALAVKGIATTSRITNSAPAPTNSELFAATPATLVSLKPYCDGLIMGKLKLHTAANDQFSGMYETHLSVDVKLISTTIGVRREFLLEEDGAGLTRGLRDPMASVVLPRS